MKNGGQNSVIQVPESQLSVKNTATNRRETLAKKFSQQRIVEHSRNASKLSNDQKRPEAKKSLRSKVPHPQKLKSSKHELSQKMEG